MRIETIIHRRKARRSLAALLLGGLILTGCSTLPSSGPTAGQINSALRKDNRTGFTIVDIDPAVAAKLGSVPAPDGGIGGLGRPGRIDALGPGDLLLINIYEVGVTLFSGAAGAAQGGAFNPAATATALDNVLVDSNGSIQLPYVGRINVTGKSPAEVARLIERGLRGLSQRAQVQVSIRTNAHNVYYVNGDVRTPGRFPLALPEERLLDAIARAGGATNPPDDVVLRLTRGGSSAESRLSAIYEVPAQNIPLLPGDRVELFIRPRTFLVFGATTKVSQVPFSANELSLGEALARIGGPDERVADASAVYLFRYDMLTPGEPAPVPVIYRLNMLRPDSYFLSQRIGMRDKDVIYIAGAAANAPGKLAQILGQLFSPILAVRSVAQ